MAVCGFWRAHTDRQRTDRPKPLAVRCRCRYVPRHAARRGAGDGGFARSSREGAVFSRASLPVRSRCSCRAAVSGYPDAMLARSVSAYHLKK